MKALLRGLGIEPESPGAIQVACRMETDFVNVRAAPVELEKGPAMIEAFNGSGQKAEGGA